MSIFTAVLLMSSIVLQPTTQPAPSPVDEDPGRALARQIVRAAGGDTWAGVTRVRFKFNVENEGKLAISAKHDWNVRTGANTVTVGDKATTCNVYESKDRTGDELTAFKRWTNDSYWLLMPLKLLDPGVKFSVPVTSRDMPVSRGRMTMSFDGVGLTPGDLYDLSVDMRQMRIDHWTYRPNEKTSAGFTWENYQDFNGLLLATERKADDGKRRIFFTDIVVDR